MNTTYNKGYKIKNINKIYNIDAIKALKELPDESINLIVSDPPYKITAKGSSGDMGGIMANKDAFNGDLFKHNEAPIASWINELYRVLKNNSACYLMTNQVNLYEYLTETQKSGFKFIKSLIWNKGNKICSRYYMNQFEYILFLRKGNYNCINNPGTSDILSVPNKKYKYNSTIHPTEKPVLLMQILIENSSNKNDLILDPFMGVGSTAIAAKRSKRNFIGYELDKNFYDVCCDRLKVENISDEW